MCIIIYTHLYSNPDTSILVKQDNSCIGKQNFNMDKFVVRSKRKKDEEESPNCQTRTATDDSGESFKTEASRTINTSSCGPFSKNVDFLVQSIFLKKYKYFYPIFRYTIQFLVCVTSSSKFNMKFSYRNCSQWVSKGPKTPKLLVQN